MKFRLIIVCILLQQFAVIADSYAITVKDTKRRTMDVEVMSFTKSSGNVRIKRKDGTIFNVKISLFDEESQKKIAQAAPVAFPELDIDISVGKRRQKQSDSVYMKKTWFL